VLPVKFNNVARLCRSCSKEGPPAGEHVELPGEFTRAMDGDEGLNGTGRTQDLNLPGDHHKERYGNVSLLDEHLTKFNHTHLPTLCNSTDLRWI
jgi:hypothetical protein